MTEVKICGLLELTHVQAAVDEGVNAIGFVFAPSKREVTVQQAKYLAQHIPSHILKVGVFVNASAAEIRSVYDAVPLDVVQYHGDETPEFIERVGLPAWKSFSISMTRDVQDALTYDAVPLFDAPGEQFRGGSGKSFDWTVLQDSTFKDQPFVLAGGLTVENVQDAIQLVNPTMVDVSSGVERKNRKDEEQIRTFIRLVKQAKGER